MDSSVNRWADLRPAQSDIKTGIAMAKIAFNSVDEYIASQPEAVRGILERVRSAIRKAVPATGRVVSAFQDELAPYEVDKGTVRFPLSQPVSVKLIGRIAKFRAKEVVERDEAKDDLA